MSRLYKIEKFWFFGLTFLIFFFRFTLKLVWLNRFSASWKTVPCFYFCGDVFFPVLRRGGVVVTNVVTEIIFHLIFSWQCPEIEACYVVWRIYLSLLCMTCSSSDFCILNLIRFPLYSIFLKYLHVFQGNFFVFG